MKEKITKHHYDYSIEIVKQYLQEQYESLPYTKGTVKFPDGRRYMEARKYKDDGRVTGLFRQNMEKGAPFQELEIKFPIVSDTYKEKRPDINLDIFQ